MNEIIFPRSFVKVFNNINLRLSIIVFLICFIAGLFTRLLMNDAIETNWEAMEECVDKGNIPVDYGILGSRVCIEKGTSRVMFLIRK